MARASKQASQRNTSGGSKKNGSGKGASNGANQRVPLKDAPKKAKKTAAAAVPVVVDDEEEREPLIFDEGTKRNIGGVALIVTAIVLLLVVLTTPTGVVTKALSSVIKLTFGFGSVVIPVILAAVGVVMLINPGSQNLSARLGVGLGLVCIAVMAMTSVNVTGAESNPALVFGANELMTRGGYIGAGIAWVLLTLLGRTISMVILIGVAIAGVIIVGFSITDTVDKLRKKTQEMRERRHEEEDEDDYTALDGPAYIPGGMHGRDDLEGAAADGNTRVMGPGTRDAAAQQAGGAEAAAGRGGGRMSAFDRLFPRRDAEPGRHDLEDGYSEEDRQDRRTPVGRRNGSLDASPYQVDRAGGQGAGAGGYASSRGFQGAGGTVAPTMRMPSATGADVPRDMSKPHRAQTTIRNRAASGWGNESGPTATSVDMYWPGEYAYNGPEAAAAAQKSLDQEDTASGAGYGKTGYGASRKDAYSTGYGAGDQDAADREDEQDPAYARELEEVGGKREFTSAYAKPQAPSSTRVLTSRGNVGGAGVIAANDADGRAVAGVSAPSDEVPFDEDVVANNGALHSAPTQLFADAANPNGGRTAMTRKLKRPSSQADGADAAAVAAAGGKAAASGKGSGRTAAQTGRSSSAGGVKRGKYTLPPKNLIKRTKRAARTNEAELRATAANLQGTLEDFGVMAKVVGWVAGPTVTLFKVELPNGVRVNRVINLGDDIALALASPGVRIFAPIPGTTYVGIEVPNRERQNVLLGDVLKNADGGPLTVAIGKDVEGHTILGDLAKMPHVLIAGTTGSGKSIAINAMVMSILMRATPDEVRFIMIDPKRVEFTPYDGIPHLYVPVVNENKEAASALAWAVAEMERRLRVLSKAGVRNIGQYNAKVDAGQIEPPEDGPEAPREGEEGPRKMPYIVIVIDELADLMMNVGKEVELSISRLAQLARAAGIHMIIATQRPSTNVVTGLIKANITNRMALTVASSIDSRVILDETGAENLIGHGDMLYSKPEYPKPVRLQGCYVSNEEIEGVVNFLKEQGEPEYHKEILQTNVIGIGQSAPDGSGGHNSSDDPLLWEAADIVVSSGMGSTSNIQRRLSVGYSRAGRIMDMLEEKGIVGPPNGSKPREVLVDELELETLKAFEEEDNK